MYGMRYGSNFVFLQVDIQSLSIIYLKAHLSPSVRRCHIAIPIRTWVYFWTYYSLPLFLFICQYHSIFIKRCSIIFVRASPPLLLIVFRIFFHIIICLFFYMNFKSSLQHSKKKVYFYLNLNHITFI